MFKKRYLFLLLSLTLSLSLMFLTACGNNTDVQSTPAVGVTVVAPTASANTETTGTEETEAYPAPPVQEREAPSYPDAEINTEPPEVDYELPETSPDSAAIAGVLIRNTVTEGYIPLTPVQLYLADIVYTDAGDAAFLKSSESGLKAALYDTGVFVFQGIPAGTYGLVVDMGFGQFPVKGDDGETFLFTVEAGESQDLGLIQVDLPGDNG